MLNWIIEQLEIFTNSRVPYILVITIIFSFVLQFTANNYIDRYHESPNIKPIKKASYLMAAKRYDKASKGILILGVISAFGVYRKKKKWYNQ